MAKGKQAKSKGKFGPVAEGKGHMFGKQAAGPQKPGVSGKSNSGDGGKYAKGGSGHMFGKEQLFAGPQVPGCTGKSMSGDGGKFAKGGSGHMFGFTGSKPAQPR